MLTPDHAREFAGEWVAAWNGHDLDRILTHYRDDVVVFVSPFAVALADAPDGAVRGLPALRDYFAAALETYPELHFELFGAVAGTNSVAVHYRSVGGREAIEVMELDTDGRVARATAHYGPPAD